MTAGCNQCPATDLDLIVLARWYQRALLVVPMNRSNLATSFVSQEVAFRASGKPWKRKVVTTEAAFEKLIAKLADEGAEVLTRDAEVLR